MKYCIKCVMPETRPGITFDEQGICSACQTYEYRKTIDYEARFKELEQICDLHRGRNGKGKYDCMIAVSGGKDSHYQVYMFKEVLKMNPLLVSVEDNFPMTKAGQKNIKNISETFGCDILSLKPNIKAQKIISRNTFERYGKPTYFLDRYIYTYPLHMAVLHKTPLLVYGENVGFEYGGHDAKDTYSAKEQINNGVGSGIDIQEILSYGVNLEDLNFFNAPENIDEIEPIYLGYFVDWNSYSNYIFAKSRGFSDLTHEWSRTHHAENFDQVDSRAYLVHAWMKYPKFGHASATDYAARFIRYGMISRNEALEIVKKHDHALDPRCVEDFCEFFGYSKSEFYSIIDKLYNQEIFMKNKFGQWVLKNPPWQK